MRDAQISGEDYEVGPNGSSVSRIVAPELPGEEPEVVRCCGMATRIVHGVTVCEGCYRRHYRDA